jgi:hypothetical protein
MPYYAHAVTYLPPSNKEEKKRERERRGSITHKRQYYEYNLS